MASVCASALRPRGTACRRCSIILCIAATPRCSKSTMLTVGDTVAGRFLLRAKLGVGGFGQVWVARDNRDDREVAIKFMHEVHRVNARVLSRFAQEAEILQRLDHPAIPRAIACGTTKEEPYIAMELVSGESLHVLLDRRSNGGEPMSGKMIRAVFGAVVSAV